ncbi:MAG TPA: hypothetical protein VFV85_00440 [Conexibacter sp.]|nr:hypothetical protein [Conexibacter sp.]
MTQVTVADVAVLARVSDLVLPPEDLVPIAAAMTAQLELAAPLLAEPLDDVVPTDDPCWHG